MTEPTLPPHEHEATPDEVVAYAVDAMRARRFTAAEKALAQVLAEFPDHADALHFSGLLAVQGGREAEGLALVRRSLVAAPGNAHAWNNLGNLLARAGDLQEASEAYLKCLEIAPDFPNALTNIGFLLRHAGDVDRAETLYRRVLEIEPNFVEALNNLASIELARSNPAEAEVLLRRAVELEPAFADAITNLGEALRRQGRGVEGAECFWKAIAVNHGARTARKLLIYALVEAGDFDKARIVADEWLALDPDEPEARHHHAAVTGTDVPPRASDAYVEAVFDTFASSFDAALETLGYRAPQLLAALLDRLSGPPAGDLALLDAGCGTGLMGPLVRARAARLVGIDLSAGMLAKAAQRRCYDQLEKAEITAALAAETAVWDVILCADTFCYFGDLAAVAAAAAGALKPGGRFFFSVEALADDDARPFRIHPANGRYAHRLTYVDAVAAAAGLVRIALVRDVLRNEGGRPVDGLFLAYEKPRGSGDTALECGHNPTLE